MIAVHAHRGASAYAPENTLPAFRLAMEMGADGFENDIHLTRDKVFVVSHDDSIARCSDGQGLIQDMTLGDLRAFDFGRSFSEDFAGTPIPTLDDVLELTHGMDILNIELKGPLPEGQDVDEALTILYRSLQKYQCISRTILSTFLHDWAKRLKELFPDLRTGLLYGQSCTPEETLSLAKTYRADAVHPALGGVTPEIVAACRKEGILVNVWTVDAPGDIDKAIALQVDGIITNKPDLVLRALGR